VHAVGFINAGLDMEMPGEPAPEGFRFLFLRLAAVPPPPNMASMDGFMDGFFGHLPEEPKPAGMNMATSAAKKIRRR